MLMGASDRGAHGKILEDVWSNTISSVPSEFGKLVYLSSLRDANSGAYHHYGLEHVYSPEQCNLALRQSHREVFYRWLNLKLSEQKEDLEFYLRSVEGDLPTILATWSTLRPYRGYLPVTATNAEREWFLSDLEVILDLLSADARICVERPSA